MRYHAAWWAGSLATTALLCLAPTAIAGDPCAGGQVHIQVSTAHGDAPQPLEGMPAGFGSRLPHTPLPPLHVVTPPTAEQDACHPLSKTFSQGTAVVVVRGGCDFLTKAAHVAAANGTLMVMVDADAGSCVVMGTNDTAHAKVLPPDKAVQCTLTAWLLRAPVFDVASMLLAALAIGTVAGGALLVGMDHQYMLRLPISSTGDDTDKRRLEEDAVLLTPAAAVGFVLVSSTLLLVLYFFLNNAMYWVLVTLYTAGAVQAMTYLLSGLTAHLLQPAKLATTIPLPLLGAMPVASIASASVSVAIAAAWILGQDTAWGWLPQNAMGVCLMLTVLRLVRLPDLRVATMLLCLAFCYDVFWVFIQPRLFGGGSVMAAVATGGQSSHLLPMLLMVPHSLLGRARGVALLGFGDVVLPGQLVALCRVVDVDCGLKLRRGYFLPALVAYAAGLLATGAALYWEVGGTEGQPALLYLVPSTLGTVCGLGAWRGHMSALWRVKADAEEASRGLLEEA